MSGKGVPAALMRGGTSKGLFFLDADLPPAGAERDALLLALMGSPDPGGKQIDGLGGATSSTSKVAVIAPSQVPGHDVDYLFGQVAVREPVIDWSGNCGNLSGAVGPFAVLAGLVPATGAMTTVRIRQANLNQTIVAHVPTRNSLPREAGDFKMAGVPGTGAEIRLEFLEPAGEGGQLLPTGNPVDQVEVAGRPAVSATLLNVSNPLIIVAAGALGLTGLESAADVDSNPDLLAWLEGIRAQAAVQMGVAESVQAFTAKPRATPRIAWIGAPAAYRSTFDEDLAAADYDLAARILSMGKLHHAYPATAAIAMAVAAALPGTLVHETLPAAARGGQLRLGHGAGVMPVGAELASTATGWKVAKALFSRTARQLFSGTVYTPE